MAVTQLTAADLELTKLSEGLVLHRYWDPYGETYTIGYGTTSGAGVVEPIPEYCTEAQATEWLLEYVNRSVVPAILERFQPENGNELAALADLGYNAGAGVFGEEPMASALRSGSRSEIAQAFYHWEYATAGWNAVLAHRRAADVALFLRTPLDPPTYNYGWYPKSWQVAVERYDVLRALEAKGVMSRKEGLWLIARKRQCAVYSYSVWLNAAKRHPMKNGKPSWGINHRGWLFRELRLRAQGKIVHPA